MEKRQDMQIVSNQCIAPTYYIEAFGVRTTHEKDVAIFDFIKPIPSNNAAILSSIAINKSIARDMIKSIFEIFPELKKEVENANGNNDDKTDR